MGAADVLDPFEPSLNWPTQPAAAAAPFTITEVNLRAKNLLERSLGLVSVVGEISNFKIVGGHAYMTLKDSASQLSAVLFKRELMGLAFKLADGMQIIATGKLTVYGAYGRYQMVMERVEPRGAGALQLAFEQLKQKLGQEGLFSTERKRKLPMVARRVAVITSPTGAVIRDIVHVATRRFPRADIVVIPTRVQGAESATSILAALERVRMLVEEAQRIRAQGGVPEFAFDVLIVARGGGSLEDLWGFNDERVARAIAASPIPVVSAVGHETDFTIADFVADVRAPTPSAAAELVFPVLSEWVIGMQARVHRMAQAVRRHVDRQWYRLRASRAALGDGRSVLRDYMQRIAHHLTRLQGAVHTVIDRRKLTLRNYDARMAGLHPKLRLRDSRNRMHRARDRIVWLMRQRLDKNQHRLRQNMHTLHALSPLAVLDRGYSIVHHRSTGDVVRDAAQVAIGEALVIRLAKGMLVACVEQSDSSYKE